MSATRPMNVKDWISQTDAQRKTMEDTVVAVYVACQSIKETAEFVGISKIVASRIIARKVPVTDFNDLPSTRQVGHLLFDLYETGEQEWQDGWSKEAASYLQTQTNTLRNLQKLAELTDNLDDSDVILTDQDLRQPSNVP